MVIFGRCKNGLFFKGGSYSLGTRNWSETTASIRSATKGVSVDVKCVRFFPDQRLPDCRMQRALTDVTPEEPPCKKSKRPLAVLDKGQSMHQAPRKAEGQRNQPSALTCAAVVGVDEKQEDGKEDAPRGGEVASTASTAGMRRRLRRVKDSGCTAGMGSKPIVGQESGEQNVEEDSRDEDDDDDDEEQQKDEGGNEAGKHKRVAVDTPSAATWKVQVGSACEGDVDEMAEFPPSPSPQE